LGLGPKRKTCGKETGEDGLDGPAARGNAAQEAAAEREKERERERERETSVRSPDLRLFGESALSAGKARGKRPGNGFISLALKKLLNVRPDKRK
jgi:hypothetical protein